VEKVKLVGNEQLNGSKWRDSAAANEVVLTALSIPVTEMWKQKPKKLD